MRCPNCGRYAKFDTVWVSGGEIKQVDAVCTKCGTVHPDDWDYETFFSDEPAPAGGEAR